MCIRDSSDTGRARERAWGRRRGPDSRRSGDYHRGGISIRLQGRVGLPDIDTRASRLATGASGQATGCDDLVMEKPRGIAETHSYRTLLIVAAFILILPLWARAIPGDVLHMDIVNIMVLAGIYACAVMGLNLLIGYAGQISLGHSAFFGIGAYTTCLLCTRFGWFPTWLGMIPVSYTH